MSVAQTRLCGRQAQPLEYCCCGPRVQRWPEGFRSELDPPSDPVSHQCAPLTIMASICSGKILTYSPECCPRFPAGVR